jgi:sulfur-oxidizing protein SoxA
MARGRGASRVGASIALTALLAGCTQSDTRPTLGLPSAPWVTRANPEARGAVTVLPSGARRAERYPGWTSEDFGRFRSYAYDDLRPGVPVGTAPMPVIAGDPKIGRRLFVDRAKGPCTGCHLVQGEDIWPAGNVGPDLSTYGDRGLPDRLTFDRIYDPRPLAPESSMPPWGAAGVLTVDEIAHLVAFLKTQKGPAPPETNPDRDPNTRHKPVGFGDNLDPTNNPAVLRAEAAQALWSERGVSGKSCADCHAGGPAVAMKGVATRYPQYVAAYGRVMSIEDVLSVHGPATTGAPVPAESARNLDLTLLIKMASNGMPVAVDLSRPENKAALERGRQSFNRRVGQRNHACADCHTEGRGADRFLGGRLLANVEIGMTRHFPTWRTSQGDVWDMRKRFQWCMTPLGTNMLPADAIEYAELELYLTSFDIGKPMSVPGIRH